MKLNGEMVYLWRAVDQEGEILESFVTKTRDKKAALTFMKKALKRHGSPEAITTALSIQRQVLSAQLHLNPSKLERSSCQCCERVRFVSGYVAVCPATAGQTREEGVLQGSGAIALTAPARELCPVAGRGRGAELHCRIRCMPAAFSCGSDNHR